MSSSPPDFSPLLTEGPKNAAFLRSSQVPARTLLRGVNKVNKTQPAKSLPHRLPPASAQRPSRSLCHVTAASKTTQRAKVTQPNQPPGDVSHNGLFAQNLMRFMHHTSPVHLCEQYCVFLFFLFFFPASTSQKTTNRLNTRQREGNGLLGSRAPVPPLPAFPDGAIYRPNVRSRRERLRFQQQMQAGRGAVRKRGRKWMETRINVGRNPGGL